MHVLLIHALLLATLHQKYDTLACGAYYGLNVLIILIFVYTPTHKHILIHAHC